VSVIDAVVLTLTTRSFIQVLSGHGLPYRCLLAASTMRTMPRSGYSTK
jgi:hypothetical protein